MNEYRGFKYDTVPGMCCPSWRIKNLQGQTIHTIPFTSDLDSGERIVRAWIDCELYDGQTSELLEGVK